jgi:ribose transport system substrate-binding protein
MKTRATGAIAVISVLGGVATACGGSSSTTTSASGVDAAGLQRATTVATKYLAPSTSLNLSVPLNTTPATHKKVVYLQMGNVGDVVVYTGGLKAATQAVQWDMKTIVYDLSNPQAVNSAVQQAVDQNPDYITISAAQVSLFQAALNNAKAKGIPVFDSYGSEPAQGAANGIYSQVAGDAQFKLFGQIAADYTISDSKGTAQVANFLLGDFASLNNISQTEKATFASDCPTTCGFNVVPVSLDQFSAGSIPSLVVSYVQTHPNVKYLQFAPGQMTVGVVAALKSASLFNGRVIFGATPQVANLQAVKDGQETAWIGLPSAMSGWYVVDAMLRYSEGMSLQPDLDSFLPTQLLTASNLPTPITQYDGPSNYPAEFKQLWKVGG